MRKKGISPLDSLLPTNCGAQNSSSSTLRHKITNTAITAPFMAVLSNGPSLLTILQPPPSQPSNRPRLHITSSIFRHRYFFGKSKFKYNSSNSRIKSFQQDNAESFENVKSEVIPEDQNRPSDIAFGTLDNKTTSNDSSFLSKLGIVLGIAAVITLVSVCLKQPSQGTSLGMQYLIDCPSSSTLAAPDGAFSFRAFGYRVMLPQYAPGWIYFWLLMAAGCGLFISEEALNIWVGISLARLLSLGGTWQSFSNSLSTNAPYMISTVLWVYWGVCISDMIPFYVGKFFSQSGASDDICSKLGVGKEKATEITRVVQRYGNLIGFVERFSIGVRNPTAFLAGAMGISPECFFAGVCCGGLITLPLQLGIGFLLRERPVFALATVATVVGIWTVFPYALAALTAVFLYLGRRRYSS